MRVRVQSRKSARPVEAKKPGTSEVRVFNEVPYRDNRET